MPYIRLTGFTPDIEETTPGAILDGSNVVPTVRGMAGAPSAVNTDLPELTATAVGAASLVQLDGTIRTFAGTGTQIYEAGSQTWGDVTRSAGGTLTAGTVMRFAQLGNDSFATNDAAVIQKSTTGKFVDVSGAPTAAIIVALDSQLMAFDTNDTGFGDQGDRWWASAEGDVDSWSPSIATGAVSGRLVKTPGIIKAGHRLYDDVVAYKEQSMYLGRYVGAPTFWEFDLISDQIGAVSHEAVIPVDTFHFFMGTDNFYVFDGARPRPIGEPIREFFFYDELDADNRNMVRGALNRERGRIAFAYPSQAGGGKLDKIIYYHIRAARWGIPISLSTELLFEFIRTTGPTYSTLGNSFSTYADLPQIPYDDPFWFSKVTKIAVFDTSHKLKTMDGPASTWSIRPWTYGQDDIEVFAHRIRPRFQEYPTSGTLVNAYSENLGQTFATDTTAILTDGKFDFERSAKWHRATHTYTGDGEIVGIDITAKEDGLE